jgi:hypothetical protein
MTITSKTFQNLQPGVQRVDDLRVRRPINEALQWLGEGLPEELNAHFASVSASFAAISQSVSVQISAHLSNRPTFRVHKNGTNQLSISASDVPVTFSTESWDTGAFFATNAWTPPAGKHRVSAQVHFTNIGGVDNELLIVAVHKNGTRDFVNAANRAGTGEQTVPLNGLVDANGTDAFTVTANKQGVGLGSINGGATLTFFCGEAV